jgi:hypothetical protein
LPWSSDRGFLDRAGAFGWWRPAAGALLIEPSRPRARRKKERRTGFFSLAEAEEAPGRGVQVANCEQCLQFRGPGFLQPLKLHRVTLDFRAPARPRGTRLQMAVGREGDGEPGAAGLEQGPRGGRAGRRPSPSRPRAEIVVSANIVFFRAMRFDDISPEGWLRVTTENVPFHPISSPTPALQPRNDAVILLYWCLAGGSGRKTPRTELCFFTI